MVDGPETDPDVNTRGKITSGLVAELVWVGSLMTNGTPPLGAEVADSSAECRVGR